MAASPFKENAVRRQFESFPSALLSVVLGTLLFVMSVAFISIPISLGGHPGEIGTLSTGAAFHPT